MNSGRKLRNRYTTLGLQEKSSIGQLFSRGEWMGESDACLQWGHKTLWTSQVFTGYPGHLSPTPMPVWILGSSKIQWGLESWASVRNTFLCFIQFKVLGSQFLGSLAINILFYTHNSCWTYKEICFIQKFVCISSVKNSCGIFIHLLIFLLRYNFPAVKYRYSKCAGYSILTDAYTCVAHTTYQYIEHLNYLM